MGGNALKNVITVRKNKNEYDNIKTYILNESSKYIICENVIELPNKESFGDLDILYINNPEINIRELVIKLFNPNEIVINGDVMSFDYDNFQIDFIKCKSKENLEMAKFYFSNGDMGSIIGRIINYYGLKFGNSGLWLNLIEDTFSNENNINATKIFGRIDLTNKPMEICKFLNLDYNKWFNGFKDKKEIFDWIISCKYYKREIFFSLNYEHRQRMYIRPFYKEFLEYINVSVHDIIKVNSFDSEIKINIQNEVIKYFAKEDELQKIIELNKLHEIRKNKFNGKILIDLGIKDKKIGKIISEFKIFINNKYNKSFEEWIDDNNKEFIFHEIKSFSHNLFNSGNNSSNIAT